MNRILFTSFKIIGAADTFTGSLIIENGIIIHITRDILSPSGAGIVINGGDFPPSVVLMPAFIDLHAHFRDPGLPAEKSPFLPAELLESASLAAAAGGYATVVCMANTRPVIDTAAKAAALKVRSDRLGIIDLYPVLSLTRGMEGRELSGLGELPLRGELPSQGEIPSAAVVMLSEDGKDVADDSLFLAAMGEAKRLGIPVSCHCDCGGPEAAAMQKAGRPRAEWSRLEENNAVRRAITLGQKAGCHIHIAHVSTGEAAEIIRAAKKNSAAANGFRLTAEATPHHIGAAEADARRMGEERFGRVNPPLRMEQDRQAIIAALNDGTIDAIATDHAPHGEKDKAAGSPGFSGLETAFAACWTHLADTMTPDDSLRRLSALMSGNPARVLGLADRGLIREGLRADLVMVDTQASAVVDPERFKSRGKCTPFAGKELRGKILMTLNAGRITFQGDTIA